MKRSRADLLAGARCAWWELWCQPPLHLMLCHAACEQQVGAVCPRSKQMVWLFLDRQSFTLTQGFFQGESGIRKEISPLPSVPPWRIAARFLLFLFSRGGFHGISVGLLQESGAASAFLSSLSSPSLSMQQPSKCGCFSCCPCT